MTLQKVISFALITIIFIPFHFAQTVIHGNIRIDHEKLSAFGDSLKLRPVTSVRHPGQNHWTINIPIEEDSSFLYKTDNIHNSILFQYNYTGFPQILIAP